MSKKVKDNPDGIDFLKNESARQRWELFHRAIAHAKESNNSDLDDADIVSTDAEYAGPLLTIVK
ncbi:MAG: hypothetical protein KJP08_01855 [Gammaproteobacteria bacterium]|nr:hypothetical protein [Gammaproteobacteria bacterium]NNF49399.1 hypothetical protein [Woeseiaceae bacterium]MBT8093528.1 hypothetical protein [Gammaproteobacteria bacterium]MBT8106508.1 hypothetical protein [Gammaproteobacteria bacterium]NNK26523.1 hypothetical protein [Woeseiaceae bacterium]